jgi:outer membrane protein OmpA-like peptidoglycan-associated protein
MKTLWIAVVCLLFGSTVEAGGAREDQGAGWKVDARRPSRFFFGGHGYRRHLTYEPGPGHENYGWRIDGRRPSRFLELEDEDGDGVPDSRDRCPGTSQGSRVDDQGCPRAMAAQHPKPAKAAEPPPPERKPSAREETLVKTGELHLEDVHFDVNQATLKPESHGVLDEMGEILTRRSDLRVEVGGHTDDTGAADHNLDLSQRRAEAVVAYLTATYPELRGRLTARGYGESRPVASNDTSGGRAKNRRVTLKVR